jgi:hypothetical protein
MAGIGRCHARGEVEKGAFSATARTHNDNELTRLARKINPAQGRDVGADEILADTVQDQPSAGGGSGWGKRELGKLAVQWVLPSIPIETGCPGKCKYSYRSCR